MSPRIIRNRLLAAGLRSCLPLPRLPLTPRHREERLLWCRERVNWRVEWRSVVFSDESRVVCMRVMDVYMYGLDLVSVIFRSEFVHDSRAAPQASWYGGAWVTTRGHIWCFPRVKKTVPATLYRFLTPCFCQFFDREVICFFSKITQVHIRLLGRNVL